MARIPTRTDAMPQLPPPLLFVGYFMFCWFGWQSASGLAAFALLAAIAGGLTFATRLMMRRLT
jgi:hypothetical protein